MMKQIIREIGIKKSWFVGDDKTKNCIHAAVLSIGGLAFLTGLIFCLDKGLSSSSPTMVGIAKGITGIIIIVGIVGIITILGMAVE